MERDITHQLYLNKILKLKNTKKARKLDVDD